MSRWRPAALLALGALLFATPAPAGEARRVWLSLGGGAVLGSVDWTGASAWEVYRETAELEAAYEAGPGPALEAAVGVRVTRRFGVRAAFGWSDRGADAPIQARIPHPFYFDQPRDLEGQASGLEYRQWAGYLDLEWRPVLGTVEVALFGGVALARVEADLVEHVEIDDAFPFETVSFRSAVTENVRTDAAVGWSAGAAVCYALGSRFGLGAQARYTRVPVDLGLEGAPTTPIDAGGLQLTATLSVGF